MIAIQAFVNIGVVTSSWPVTGVPLPFISFGGSSLVVNLIAVALIANVGRRRRRERTRGVTDRLSPAAARADTSIRRSRSPTRCAPATRAYTFVGTADRLESRIVPQGGVRPARDRGPAADAVVFRSTFWRPSSANVKGTLQSLALLAAARPDIVVATGGYVCFPVVLAARIRRAAAAHRRADRSARAQRDAGSDESPAGAAGRRGVGRVGPRPTHVSAQIPSDGHSDPRRRCALAGARSRRCPARPRSRAHDARSRWAAAKARAPSTTRCSRWCRNGELAGGMAIARSSPASGEYRRVSAALQAAQSPHARCRISTTWPTRTPRPTWSSRAAAPRRSASSRHSGSPPFSSRTRTPPKTTKPRTRRASRRRGGRGRRPTASRAGRFLGAAGS